MDKLITRIARTRGWESNDQSFNVQYQIDTKEWPWSKSTKRWVTSRSFDFNQYNEDKEGDAYDAACQWLRGIETTGDPDVAEVIDLSS